MAVSRLEVSVPVAVLHVVELVWGPRDGAGDAGVAPRAPGEELEVGPRHVLVTLQAVVQAPVGLVVWLPADPAKDAESPALLPGLLDVELPDGDAGHGEPEADEAVPHQSRREEAESPASPDWLRQVLLDVNTEILEVGTAAAVPGVGHYEPLSLALAQAGEVPAEKEMTVRVYISRWFNEGKT